LKEDILKSLNTVVEFDLARIWRLEKPEVSFTNLIVTGAFTLLENPANLKTKSLKELLLQLLVNVERCSEIPVHSVLNLIMKYDHLTSTMVSLIQMITNENNTSSTFVNDLFIEIGKFDNEEFAADNNGAKLLGIFIEEISDKVPKTILNFMSLLVSHLNIEFYPIRNAVLTAISRILVEIKDEGEKKDQFFDILLERLKDSNAYTRSRCIQCWGHLCENKSIPLSLLSQIVTGVVDRLQDKSALVRKSAIQFLITLLQYNPYGDVLEKAHFVEQLESIKKKILENPEMPKNEMQNLTSLVGYYTNALSFIEEVHKVVPTTCRLLDSKTSSDVQECVKFFSIIYAFKIEVALVGIKEMLKLIYSKEESIRESIIKAFKEIFLSRPMNSPESCIEATKSIIALIVTCNLAELSFLEAIIAELVKDKNSIPEVLILALWELYEQDDIGSMIFLSMIAQGQPKMVKQKLKTLMKALDKKESLVSRYTLSILEKMDPKEKLESNHLLFQILEELLVGDLFSINDWIPIAEKSINIIFSFAKKPQEISAPLIKKLTKKTNITESQSNNVSVSTIDLSKLMFSLGHCALKELVCYENEYKESRAQKSKNEDKKSNEEDTGLESITSKENDLDEWLENQELYLISNDSVYGSFIPLVVSVASNEDYKDTMVRRCAILTLCKFMCLHASICEKYIQLIFTLLSKGSNSIKSNIIVSLGDMACRYPNVIEPWTSHLYKTLSDKNDSVRKKTLLVLTHLILNDMIKTKANMTDIAKCILDKDVNIVSHTKSFFNELSKRGTNPIYNILPDVISRLSSEENEENFRSVLKFLLSFITKDRQIDQLVEKLCTRFKSTTVEKEWRDIAYCISILSHNEKSIKKLIQSIKLYSHTLQDEEIFELLSSVKSKNLKGDMKMMYDEWEVEMRKFHFGEENVHPEQNDSQKSTQHDSTTQESTQDSETTASQQLTSPTSKKKKTAAKKPKKAVAKKKPKKVSFVEEEEDEDEMYCEE
jgi:condensin complex subunit 1